MVLESEPGFFSRMFLAFLVFFKVLFDGALAGRVQRAVEGRVEPALLPQPAPAEVKAVVPAAPAAAEKKPDGNAHHPAALHLLAIFQREGRLIDFLQEDITAFPDGDVGAAARVVHAGCRKALSTYLKLQPVMAQEEGSSVTVEPGFDAARIRLTGNVVGKPPFKGQLKHKGWKVSDVTLPPPPHGMDVNVVAPAEVEL